MEQEYEMPGGSLYYELMTAEDPDAAVAGIRITRFQGSAGEVDVPAQIQGICVREIGKKAFLSKKNLRKVTLPSCLAAVGDWAFAYCSSLHTVVFRDAEPSLTFGKAVFLECDSLAFVYVRDGKTSTAALLAAAVITAQAPYLLDAAEAGGEEWLAKWDARMLAVLHAADDEGYARQVLCGEEDYGSTDLAAYESARRRQKVRLLLLRCLYPEGLRPEHERRMQEYLRAHTKGCVREETWQVVLQEHGEDRSYYELFAKLGCVTRENLDALLADAGGSYPELSAYLIRYQEETFGHGDFFAGLEL